MLYLVGLGLGDENDITKRGLEVVKASKRILLESYTSILPGLGKERLEELYGKPVEIAYREKVEEDIEEVSARTVIRTRPATRPHRLLYPRSPSAVAFPSRSRTDEEQRLSLSSSRSRCARGIPGHRRRQK